MTINKAKQELRMLSSGTLATLTGFTKYEEIENQVDIWECHIEDLPQTIAQCNTWQEVVAAVKDYEELCISLY